MAEPSLFDHLNDITKSKQGIFHQGETNKNYSPFMINRGLQQHVDTILLANEMNKRPNISKEMHHDYLFHSVDPKLRYGKWAKQDTTDLDLIEYIKDRYSVNHIVALDYIQLFDREQLKIMMDKSKQKGGRG